MQPQIRRFIVGHYGIDQGTMDVLVEDGMAANHRVTEGRYAGAEIDFHEVCDAYDRFGPCLSGARGVPGDRFVAMVIGPSPPRRRPQDSGATAVTLSL